MQFTLRIANVPHLLIWSLLYDTEVGQTKIAVEAEPFVVDRGATMRFTRLVKAVRMVPVSRLYDKFWQSYVSKCKTHKATTIPYQQI